MFKIEFKTGNAAFGNNDSIQQAIEIQRILGNISRLVEDGITEGICSDINGNKIGKWGLTDD